MTQKSNQGINSLLRQSNFQKLWLGQVFSQLADKFYIILMVYLIAQYWTNNTPTDNEAIAEVAAAIRMDFTTHAQRITLLATGIYVANTIPAILFGTLAGAFIDRWKKIPIMVASNGIRATLVLLVPIFLLPGPTWLGLSWGYWSLLLMTFFESLLTQFFAPAEQSTIPLLVPKKDLLAANSIYQATSMGATIVGFALGDPILRGMKALFLQIGISGGEFILLPLCYGIAAISISSIKVKEKKSTYNSINIFSEINEGINTLQDKANIRNAMVHLVVLYSLLAALYVLSISLASSITLLGPTNFGILLATSALGMTLGSVLVAQIGNKFSRKTLTSLGLGAITFTLIMLGEARGSLTLTLILCGALGIGAALVAIPAQTTIQEETPEAKRGKVFGLQNNLINISLSLPLALAGALVSKYGLIPVLWILAGLALIAAILERPWIRC